jgi:hypothetical protein
MDAEEYKHKLTAILKSNVTGYSLLMGDREDETDRTLKSDRNLIAKIFKH